MCLQTFTEIETTHFLYTTASWKIATVKQKRTKRNKRFLFYNIGDALSFLVDNQAELKRLSGVVFTDYSWHRSKSDYRLPKLKT